MSFKQRLLRAWCRFRGGCTYSDKNLEFTHDLMTDRYIVRNRCCRCGKEFISYMTREDLLNRRGKKK